MPEIIVDTSVLQYLHQIGLLELLPLLYERIVVPQGVADELIVGRRRGIELPILEELPWVEVRSARIPEPLGLLSELGSGELEVLALAATMPDAIVVLDDSRARRHARTANLRFAGTLGILLRAKATGHLDSVAPALAALEKSGFRLDSLTRAAVLRLAGEEQP